jgi:2-methylcitrate dehydratase PrpD
MSMNEVLDFIEEISFERLPNDAVAAAKIPILDCLGVAIAGSQEDASKIIDNYLIGSGGNPEAGVIGAGYRTSLAQAAWANGTRAHILDYDDYYLPYHPTVTILPAVLAAAEKYHLSGKDLLLAYIAGFEVQADIAAVMGREHYERGWHSTSLLGTLGAAASLAKMLKLQREKAAMALGIAGSLACGLRRNFGSMTKSLHAGNAARNGVVAAVLARDGFTADSHILEGNLGFLDVLGTKKEHEIGRVLGSKFYIISPGVSIKPYPSCAGTHWAIDAVLSLRKDAGINFKDIAEIECRTSKEVPRILIHSRPRTALEGKFSLEYCITIAFIDGEVRLKQFTDERVQDPQAQELLKRVRYVHPPEMGDKLSDIPSEMIIKLKNGRTYSCLEKRPKGTPDNPLTQIEIEEKFKDCVSKYFSPPLIDRVLYQIMNLESIEDISDLMSTFTFIR